MKNSLKILGCALLMLCMPRLAAAAVPDEVAAQWERANLLYINADYDAAADAYEAIASTGCVSGKLFYNLGNAYFKAGDIAHAVLNYHKAARLDPFDKDVRYNLAVANGYVKDRIDAVPEFFLTAWVRSLRAVCNANGWAVVSIVLLALALTALLLFIVAERTAWRKCGFFTGIVCFVLFAVAVAFAAADRHNLRHPAEAVVMQQSVPVKSSPDASGSDLFILHEGTCVKVLTDYGDWTEIAIPDGNKGWLHSDALELIAF